MTNQEIKAVQTLIARQERRTDALIALLVSKGKLTEDEVKAFREAVRMTAIVLSHHFFVYKRSGARSCKVLTFEFPENDDSPLM